MKIRTPTEFQTFNDGICRIFSVENIAASGDLPKEGRKEKFGRVPYERRTVGCQRFYAAKQAAVKVEELIRIPQTGKISTQDLCMIEGRLYRIRQVQQIMDTMPEATDLSLERLEEEYEPKGIS
ncbi:MAG: hypothetical protein HFI67_12025 [Lachnospiraceae bacterium]|jgi:hypothetical protein|nr:hypothetical protein [Lachnospiraceae bacterium]